MCPRSLNPAPSHDPVPDEPLSGIALIYDGGRPIQLAPETAAAIRRLAQAASSPARSSLCPFAFEPTPMLKQGSAAGSQLSA